MRRITKLSEKAPEGGSFTIVAEFKEVDVDGTTTSFTPKSPLVWSLKDKSGNIINSRDAVPLTPASSVKISLAGDDLALAGASALRAVTIEGTYDGLAGTDIPVVAEVRFEVVNLIGMP